MSTTTGFGERRRIDPTLMYAVHDAFRRDLDRFATRPAQRAGWDRFTKFLRIHHAAEDAALWPVLREKLAERPADLQALARLETERMGLTARLDAVDAAIALRAPLKAEITRLAESFTAHLDHEEHVGLPLVADLFTRREWTSFADEQRRLLGFTDAGRFLPWLLDGAPAEVQRTVLAAVPPPDRLLFRRLWRPRYRPVAGLIA